MKGNHNPTGVKLKLFQHPIRAGQILRPDAESQP